MGTVLLITLPTELKQYDIPNYRIGFNWDSPQDVVATLSDEAGVLTISVLDALKVPKEIDNTAAMEYVYNYIANSIFKDTTYIIPDVKTPASFISSLANTADWVVKFGTKQASIFSKSLIIPKAKSKSNPFLNTLRNS